MRTSAKSVKIKPWCTVPRPLLKHAQVSSGRSSGGVERRASGTEQSGGGSGRGLNDMLCLGFVVVSCLNLGSVTARQEGFFAAEVACLSPGAETVLVSGMGCIWDIEVKTPVFMVYFVFLKHFPFQVLIINCGV